MNPSGAWEKKWLYKQPLGAGGQGETHLVANRDNSEHSGVLKVLRSDKQRDPKARRRMYHEVANLRVLGSTKANIPKVLDGNTDSFEDPTIPLYFVMEYIQGPTLAELIRDKGSLDVQNSVSIASTLCETLKIAFNDDIVHRDIKPENLKVRDLALSDVVMLDFGLSFNRDDDANLTEPEEALDNKFLSLPEKRGAHENKRDQRSDLTCVCAILFYCLTGVVPRDLRDSGNRAPHRWSRSAIEAKVKHPAQLLSLDALLDKGFSVELLNRFQTVAELKSRLEEVLNPPPFPPTENLETIAKREGRRLDEIDSKTRLARFRKNAKPLETVLDDYIRQHHGKLEPFRLRVYDPTNRAHKLSQGSLVLDYVALLEIAEHQERFEIHYTGTVEGTECCIWREITRVMPGRQEVERQTLVQRYSVDEGPSTAYIKDNLKAAVAETMIRFCDGIAKAAEPRSVASPDSGS